MKQLALGTLLSALALFIWGFLYWGPFGGFGGLQPLDLDTAEVVGEALLDHFPETGVYYLPNTTEMGDEAAMAQLQRLHEQGPLATIAVRREGAPVMSPTVFAGGFIHMLLMALVLGLALLRVSPVLPTYRSRVMAVSLFGLAATLWSNFSEPIWYYQPWSYHIGWFVYDFTGWVLVALILARFVKK